jgi:hypothetical protein
VLHQCLINPQLSVRQALLDTDSYLDVQVRHGKGRGLCSFDLSDSYLDVQVRHGKGRGLHSCD